MNVETKTRVQAFYWEVIPGTREGVEELGKKGETVNCVLLRGLPLQVTGEPLCRTYFKTVTKRQGGWGFYPANSIPHCLSESWGITSQVLPHIPGAKKREMHKRDEGDEGSC